MTSPMTATSGKSVRQVAAGYGIFGLMFFVMAAIWINSLGWAQAIHAVRENGDARYVMGLLCALGLLNVLLAIGAWKVFSLRRWLRYALLVVCIAIPAYLVVSDVVGLIDIYFRRPIAHSNTVQSLAALALAVGYVLQAWSLVRAVRSNR